MLTRYILFTLILLLPLAAFAQGPGFDDDVQDAPVDGGVTILAAAAVGYGIKKLKDRNKQK